MADKGIGMSVAML